MNPAIEVNGLVRRFGSFCAVDGISLRVAAGEVLGLLGPNGAGKTTTIRVLTGILTPTAGTVSILGLSVPKDRDRLKSRIGYVSQRFSLYEELTADENLRFFGAAYGLPRARLAGAVRAAIADHNLAPYTRTRADELPSGARQRLALACALLHDPGVLFLDEPTAGMDPFSRHDFWARIHVLAEQGKAIIITTHYLDEAQYCHNLCLINHGRIVAAGTPSALRAQPCAAALQIACTPLNTALAVLLQHPELGEVSVSGNRLRLLTADPTRARAGIVAALAGSGVTITDITPDQPSLEDVFVQLARLDRRTKP